MSLMEKRKEAIRVVKDRYRCCTCCHECVPFQPWFSVEDPATFRKLDIQATFGPYETSDLKAKSVTCGYILLTQILAWTIHPHPDYSYEYYNSWSLLLATIYAILSFSNTLFEIPQPNDDFVRGRALLTWIVFNLAVFSQFLTTVAYLVYMVLLENLDQVPGYLEIATHGLVFVVVCVDGFVINRIPLRWPHLWLNWMLLLGYMVFSVLRHDPDQYVQEQRGYDDDFRNGDDGFHSLVVSWEDEDDMFQSMFMIVGVFVTSPLLFGILRALSVSLGACTGDRRRYLVPDVEPGYSDFA